jgi:hypothetical protein
MRAAALVPAAALLLAAPASAATRCAPRGSIGLARNAQVRVYKQPSADHTAMRYYGCVRRTGRTVRLEVAGPDQIAYGFRLSGYVVGYAIYTQVARSEESYADVASWNIRRRKRIHAAPAVDGPASSSVTKLVVAASGALSWIGRVSADPQHFDYEVHIFDSRGNRVVDDGADIDGQSLALSGHTVSWTRAGVAKSATIGA